MPEQGQNQPDAALAHYGIFVGTICLHTHVIYACKQTWLSNI